MNEKLASEWAPMGDMCDMSPEEEAEIDKGLDELGRQRREREKGNG